MLPWNHIAIHTIRIQISEDKTLEIRDIRPSDEGIYICEASNQGGTLYTSARLTINCEYILAINQTFHTITWHADYYGTFQKTSYFVFLAHLE